MTRRTLIGRMRRLSTDMAALGADMDYYGGLAHWAQHGKELCNTSVTLRAWACEAEDEMDEELDNGQ